MDKEPKIEARSAGQIGSSDGDEPGVNLVDRELAHDMANVSNDERSRAAEGRREFKDIQNELDAHNADPASSDMYPGNVEHYQKVVNRGIGAAGKVHDQNADFLEEHVKHNSSDNQFGTKGPDYAFDNAIVAAKEIVEANVDAEDVAKWADILANHKPSEEFIEYWSHGITSDLTSPAELAAMERIAKDIKNRLESVKDALAARLRDEDVRNGLGNIPGNDQFRYGQGAKVGNDDFVLWYDDKTTGKKESVIMPSMKTVATFNSNYPQPEFIPIIEYVKPDQYEKPKAELVGDDRELVEAYVDAVDSVNRMTPINEWRSKMIVYNTILDAIKSGKTQNQEDYTPFQITL